ncbi:cell division protein FtsQ/DivIB [soil metagenome]
MKKIIMISLWAVFAAGLIFVMSFAGHANALRLAPKPVIVIERQNADRFLEEEDVINLLNDHNKLPTGKELSTINVSELENLILSHPAVESCDAFMSVGGQVTINIIQRKTIARMTNVGNESYYFDSHGKLMPWSDEYTSPVLFVNGYFAENYASMYHHSFDSWSVDSAMRSPILLDDIWQIAKRIEADTFLRAQIVQLYITADKQFQMIPRVGDHVINLGDISDLDEKLNKLVIFYKDGLNHTGSWTAYSLIDLQYKNQIVCTKKIKENGI